jgi:Helix-turn-helix of DDE superfamily endonuclease
MPNILTPTHFYQNFQKLNHHKFHRMVGLKQKQFAFLLELFEEYVELNNNKDWDKRGCKGGFTLADKLLLTFRYLRDYPTFLVVGHEFGISESYAYKIFTKVSESLVKILKLPNIESLNGIDLGNILIDVSEQETERPKKNKT